MLWGLLGDIAFTWLKDLCWVFCWLVIIKGFSKSFLTTVDYFLEDSGAGLTPETTLSALLFTKIAKSIRMLFESNLP